MKTKWVVRSVNAWGILMSGLRTPSVRTFTVMTDLRKIKRKIEHFQIFSKWSNWHSPELFHFKDKPFLSLIFLSSDPASMKGKIFYSSHSRTSRGVSHLIWNQRFKVQLRRSYKVSHVQSLQTEFRKKNKKKGLSLLFDKRSGNACHKL